MGQLQTNRYFIELRCKNDLLDSWAIYNVTKSSKQFQQLPKKPTAKETWLKSVNSRYTLLSVYWRVTGGSLPGDVSIQWHSNGNEQFRKHIM